MTNGWMVTIPAVAQTLRVLEMLAGAPQGQRVSHVAEELGVNKAIAHRILQMLVADGYVRKDNITDAYVATFRLGALGLRQVETAGLERWAQGTLDALARKTQELVRLAIASGPHLQWVAKSQGSNSRLILDPASGADVVLHATASGKAWLATLAEQDAESLIAEATAQTPRTETDVTRLRRILREARTNGYAITLEEMDPGVNAIAAPIVGDGSGLPATGTVSIAGPAYRLGESELLSFVPDLLAAANELSVSWPAYRYLKQQEGLAE
jgi:IclR family transcriptional regulator, acetate operon repressor